MSREVVDRPKAAKNNHPKSTHSGTATPVNLEAIFQPGSASVRLREFDHPWRSRREVGKLLRVQVPRNSHAEYKVAPDRPDPLELLNISNMGRVKELIPLRMGRMAASPFAFLRGAACVMAWDLSKSPNAGINVVICGDAHINNFGMYGTPQHTVVFDLNDFDESTIGPWEWDLKRLVASVNVAARENGLNKAERETAVLRAVSGYRDNLGRLEAMGVMDVWYLSYAPETARPIIKRDPKVQAIIEKTVAKAKATTSATLLRKVAENGPEGWRFREDPPILIRVNAKIREKVIRGLEEYAGRLPMERFIMLNRYHVVDIAHRVVGVGSVGTRAFLAMLMGNDDNDPLFLQVKECVSPAHAPYTRNLPEVLKHHGTRVVAGQRALQAAGDVMLGPTTVDGRPFFVRQMKNMKASVPIEWLTGETFNYYVAVCGGVLARAHARAGDAAAIAGYCGKSPVLDEALAKWAEAYGDQTERDHDRLVKAIKSGRVKAISEA